MEDLVKQLAERVGIDRATAEKVMGLFQEKTASAPGWLSSEGDQFVQTLQQKVGLDKSVAEKVVAFFKEHAADLQKWLEGQGGGILQKAKDALGGILGRKETK